MGLIESWQENRDRIAEEIGGSVTKVRERSLIVDGATKVICYIAEFHPDNYNRTTPFLRALIDSTCRAKGEAGLEPRPAPPFTGGQCPGVQYEVLAQSATQFNGEFRPDRASRLVVFGPIDDIFVARPTPVDDPRIIALQCFARDSNDNEAYFGDPIGGAGWTAQLLSVEINRLDGLPDDCGDVGLQDRPPTAPIPEAERKFDVTFDNDTMVFDVDLTTLEGDKITFTNNDFDVVVDLDGFKTETDEEKPTTTTKFVPDELEETPVAEEEEEVEEEDEEIEFLTVTVTTLPDSGRTYVSQNPDDIHFNAAYLRWLGSGEGAKFSYPDIPIRRLKTVHKRPDEASGYRIYAVNGASISVSKYTQKVESDT